MKNKSTILVVDDEVKITEVVKSYLENAGYQVICAYNGKEAMSLFDKASPVLVVLDLMLPDIMGEDVCRAIRKRSRVPIIMLTAKVEDADIINGGLIWARMTISPNRSVQNSLWQESRLCSAGFLRKRFRLRASFLLTTGN